MDKKKGNTDLTEGKVWKVIVRFALPLLIGKYNRLCEENRSGRGVSMKQLIRYISLVVVCICTFLLSGCSFVWTTENGDPATPEDIKSSVEKEFAVVHPNLVLQSSVVEQECVCFL